MVCLLNIMLGGQDFSPCLQCPDATEAATNGIPAALGVESGVDAVEVPCRDKSIFLENKNKWCIESIGKHKLKCVFVI